MDVEKHVGVSSNLTFKDCYTDGSAGALRARALRVRKPTAVLSFQNVSSKQSIGAVHVLGSFETRGTVLFDSIRSWGHSGALLVEGKAELESGARVHFSNCTAKRNSGAATITEGLMISTEALMTFETRNRKGTLASLVVWCVLYLYGVWALLTIGKVPGTPTARCPLQVQEWLQFLDMRWTTNLGT